MQPGVDILPVLWGAMAALREQGFQVQPFLSRACFERFQGSAVVSGTAPRHLDSWTMSPGLCRACFLRGAEGADISIVEGEFQSVAGGVSPVGSLDLLCDWLDLPRIGVLDVSLLEGALPPRPPLINGVFLDRVPNPTVQDWEARIQKEWNIEVLGSLPPLPHVRCNVSRGAGGSRPPREVCELLGQHFCRRFRVDKLFEIAAERGLPRIIAPSPGIQQGTEPIRVALAHDRAFNAYFADTLDALEACGATIHDFSPLHDDRLPEGADVVYLGCGHPERHARELAQNHCMKLALRDHLCNGGRIYAEGGGLAYLCWQMDCGDGELHRMAGVFAASATLNAAAAEPQPIEVTTDQPTWLAPAGTVLRGYLNGAWRIEPLGLLVGCVDEPAHHHAILRSGGAIGSRVHLNFASAPHLLTGFFAEGASRLEPNDPWSVTI